MRTGIPALGRVDKKNKTLWEPSKKMFGMTKHDQTQSTLQQRSTTGTKTQGLAVCVLLTFVLSIIGHTAAAKSLSTAGAGLATQILPQTTEGIPSGLIYDDQKSRFIFWASLQEGHLYLLERTKTGNYLQKQRVPISIGKKGFGKEMEGDQRTPVGVYHITSFISDEQLDSKYGLGAYPLSYPNQWDKLSKRTGSGIWLHGLPKGVATRPKLDSDGCVVVSNEVLQNYAPFISTGESLFVLSEEMNWLSPGAGQASSDVLVSIDKWKAAWMAKDNPRYLGMYHEDFTDSKRNLSQWSSYKTRVNNSKSYIKVKLSQMSVVVYPGEENLVISRFYQEYESNNFKWKGWKQLLWRRNQDGEWRILFEGNG